jgi:hypothetical protein
MHKVEVHPVVAKAYRLSQAGPESARASGFHEATRRSSIEPASCAATWGPPRDAVPRQWNRPLRMRVPAMVQRGTMKLLCAQAGNIFRRRRLSGKCRDTLSIRRFTSEEVPVSSFDRPMTPLDLCAQPQTPMTRPRSNSWRDWKVSGIPKSLRVLWKNSEPGSTSAACRGWFINANASG